MDIFGNALSTALGNLFSSLPVILGAVILLLIFWILGSILGGLVSRLLRKTGIDAWPERFNVEKYLEGPGFKITPSGAIGGFVKWFIRLFGISAAVSALGLAQVSLFLDEVLAYLPNVLVAALILALGLYLAQLGQKFAYQLAAAARFSNPSLIGKLVRYALLFFTGLVVLDQLKVASAIVIGLWAAVAGAIALALAIAVGLGGREVAHSYLTSRALAQDIAPGSVIVLGGLSGQVNKVSPYFITLRTDTGLVKIPLSLATGNTVKVISDTSTAHLRTVAKG
ncbi:MAG TPA: hypothetical protein VH186_14095 [Chloroflexia bacterium]|nr:hypothetical protein [Chloroflexia bacterium]